MIAFRPLPDDHPDLAYAPLLRAALLTLQYAQEHGAIGLTKTKAFKRVFVNWAVETFAWPGKSAAEMFRYSKVINEFEFPPLEGATPLSSPSASGDVLALVELIYFQRGCRTASRPIGRAEK